MFKGTTTNTIKVYLLAKNVKNTFYEFLMEMGVEHFAYLILVMVKILNLVGQKIGNPGSDYKLQLLKTSTANFLE